MKKKSIKGIYSFLLCGLIAVSLMLASCHDDADKMSGPPVVTEVRNYAASPNDTVVHSLQGAQWVVLMGKNMNNVAAVFFGRVQASINSTLTTGQSIVIQVPSIPFQSIPRDQVNEITVIDKNGTISTFAISITGAPIISHVRIAADAPNDTIVNVLFPGQQVNLVGYNLVGATEISFQGIKADLKTVVYTDTSVVVHIPADLSGANVSLANKITYTTPLGTVVFPIKIVGPPIIESISCENPSEGTTVSLKGYNFISIQKLTFAGTEISSFKETTEGDAVEFVVPVLTQSGPVVVTTPAGTFTTKFNVNDMTTDVIVNFDDISPVGWGGWGATVSSSDTDFPGNHGKYAVLQNDVIPAWDWAAWSGGRIIILDPVKWMSTADSTSLDSWAVKFEINVPEAWNGTSLFVSSEHNDFRITWEPWKTANGKTAAFTTSGWQTITLPFSLFTAGWGGTKPPTGIKDLLNNPESQSFAIQTMNIGSGNSATGLKAAVDNVRIVKIK